MEDIHHVLEFYNIQAHQINKVTDFVYKIKDDQQIYALKESSLTKERLSLWEEMLNQAQELKLRSILPIYLTRDRSLYVENNESIYYLMPWVQMKQLDLPLFYKSIGSIHRQTKKDKKIDKEQVLDSFKQYKKSNEDLRKKLLLYVEQFELQRYMSPFALQVCTHYHHLEHILAVLNKQLSRFVDKEMNNNRWNHTRCHGSLSITHFIPGDPAHFINWEKTFIGNPTLDLIDFFKQEINQNNLPLDSLIEHFPVYLESNQLTMKELLYIIIHLLDPSDYFSVIQSSKENPSWPMIKQVQKLEQAYGILLFGLQFSDFVEREYEGNIQE